MPNIVNIRPSTTLATGKLIVPAKLLRRMRTLQDLQWEAGMQAAETAREIERLLKQGYVLPKGGLVYDQERQMVRTRRRRQTA